MNVNNSTTNTLKSILKIQSPIQKKGKVTWCKQNLLKLGEKVEKIEFKTKIHKFLAENPELPFTSTKIRKVKQHYYVVEKIPSIKKYLIPETNKLSFLNVSDDDFNDDFEILIKAQKIYAVTRSTKFNEDLVSYLDQFSYESSLREDPSDLD